MHKRYFLGAAAALPLAAHAATAAAGRDGRGPALLTVTGAIPRSNRGPFDPVLDQMMHKQQVSFTEAWAFDWPALQELKAQTIRPTLEYDAKPHVLSGPALLDVVARAGASVTEKTVLVLRAVDGYNVEVTAPQAKARGFIVATHIDGKPMPLGGLGPLWAIYDADRVPDVAKLPLAQRFSNCPWGLYHVEVR